MVIFHADFLVFFRKADLLFIEKFRRIHSLLEKAIDAYLVKVKDDWRW